MPVYKYIKCDKKLSIDNMWISYQLTLTQKGTNEIIQNFFKFAIFL